MRSYSGKVQKPFIIIMCVLGILVLFCLKTKDEKKHFLGVEKVTKEEGLVITNNRVKIEDGNLSEVLYFNKNEIIKSADSVYYLPLSEEEQWENGTISAKRKDCNICVIMGDEIKKKSEYQSTGEKIKLILYNDESYQEVELILTALPVMSIEFMECPKDVTLEQEEFFCKFGFYAPKKEGERRLQSVTDYCKIHKRGGSTKAYEKCGLKVELVDEKGKKENRNLCNLRDDDDWILIPMYVEESKIRDKFSIDLWQEISKTELENNAGTQMEYVELILNGSYFGLYGLSVPIDEKQLALQSNEEDSDILFRIDDLNGVDLEALSQAGMATQAGNISVKFPKEMNQAKWNAIKDFLYLVYYEEDAVFKKNIQHQVELDNMADCYLFSNLIYGKDNTVKNMFYCMRLQGDGTYKVSLIPWDMDLSLGILHVVENSNGLSWEYDTDENLKKKECACYLTKRLRKLNVGNFEELLKEKYKQYKKNIFAEDNLFMRIEKLSDTIMNSGAYARDEERWPKGGHSSDYTQMRAALRKRMMYLHDLEE